ncbi:hypothetical protein MUP29_09055 [bacterium]|nr:hypothetical protein [bacterium]
MNRGPLSFDKLMILSHANGVISASKDDNAWETAFLPALSLVEGRPSALKLQSFGI